MTAEQLAALSGHTQGPWTAEPDVDLVVDIISADGRCIASIWEPEAYPADTRLLAAAPDLLALCREQTALIELWRVKIASHANASRAQVCGHPAACIVSHGETHHCGWCEAQARADRLARILAVERGDASAAPSGWGPRGRCEWEGHGWEVSCWGLPTGWRLIDRRNVSRPVTFHDTALEAIEAADAARGE